MKSIRLSLLGYFLVLLALALGAVSFLVYQITEQTLSAKEADANKLLREKNEKRLQEQHDKLDLTLLSQARTLGRMVLFSFINWPTIWKLESLYIYSNVSSSLLGSPNMGSLFIGENGRGGLAEFVVRASMEKAKISEEVLHTDPTLAKVEYFQVRTQWGQAWKSRSLNDDSLIENTSTLDAPQFSYWNFDDIEKDGAALRHLTYKMPLGIIRPLPGTGRAFGSGGRNRGENSLKPPTEVLPSQYRSPPPMLYVQTASTTAERDAAMKAIEAEVEEEMDKFRAESKATLDSLRNRLLLISVATFGATILGGFGLIWLGLRPLGRLTDAVSRVSTKDFRLPLDERRPLPSELRPVAERLTQTLEMLKRAFAREKQSAADISHELRTPLAALMTTLEVALKKPRSTEEYREMLEDCRLSGQQMSRLVERLLTLARLDAGVDTLRAQSVDASTLAEQCVAVVRPLADARGLDLQVHRNGPALIVADPSKLSEVMTNLLHNAIQYNRPSGKVEFSVARQNGHLHLQVSDTGIGISPEARDHIFERFYRADSSRSADGLHAGLGLAIVKGYVDLMGGTISVESTEGVGSTFRVDLPAA
jgi:two-component system, OmpR family, heavy metal sensor histidine kinase CusS